MRSMLLTILTCASSLLPILAAGLEHPYRPAEDGPPSPESLEAKWMSQLKAAWEEASNLSPFACILLVLPVIFCFICVNCVFCLCIRCCSKSRNKRRDSSSSRLELKSRDGTLDPIPLTGLVQANKSQIGFHPLRPVVGRHTTNPYT